MKINKQNILFILTLASVLFSSCKKKEIDTTCEGNPRIDYIEGSICEPKIMAYHFGIETMPISEQITTLINLQMDGIILEINADNLKQLNTYYSNCNVHSGAFKIYDIFTTVSLDDAKACETQLKTIEHIYKIIQHKDTRLQVLFSGTKNSVHIQNTISKIANIANHYNKILIIYPHEGLAIETAEDALSYISSIDKSNVFLSVHLCHELAAGNENRIAEVINNVAPYIKSVSISGATLSEQFNTSLPEWYWGIKPLSMGTYDYAQYYKALYDNNYKGPIAIHTWGIYNNFNLKVENHLPNSKNIITKMSEDLCN